MGYTQNCEIWRGSSLGTLIMIQEDLSWRTRWGPCFVHKMAIFWPFLGNWTMVYTQNSKVWHGVFLGTLIMIQEEPIWGTMWGPYFGHIRVIFWPFLGLLIHWVVKWKTGHSCRPLVLFSQELRCRCNYFPSLKSPLISIPIKHSKVLLSLIH